MDRIDAAYGRFLEGLAVVACALIFGMSLMICADVFLRNVRIVPGMVGLEWANEISEGLQRAASDVAIERLRQVHGEGFSLERDDAYTDGQLARAALCLLVPAAGVPRRLQNLHWPFNPAQLKPGPLRADLVKAAALIIAEIERIDRAEAAA